MADEQRPPRRRTRVAEGIYNDDIVRLETEIKVLKFAVFTFEIHAEPTIGGQGPSAVTQARRGGYRWDASIDRPVGATGN